MIRMENIDVKSGWYQAGYGMMPPGVGSVFAARDNGAYIGDMFKSIIHTCALSKINPLEYLTALQKNSSALFANPSRWLPWNYK